jgi:hypothetical protein
MVVLVEDAAEMVCSVDVQSGEVEAAIDKVAGVGDSIRAAQTACCRGVAQVVSGGHGVDPGQADAALGRCRPGARR